ncbi:DUF202 domain-containing protein [Mycolicibacterium fallax]|uniref:Uncharacterized protein n=1 Tax=Mycolicibacterium fallax TaxID=1793 RepID=A0A1X1R7I1_MYCFA|nr:DUF202 domain-containing protein [Mycolicibacterium fallax]ORV00822.1 hypothetical protein AWC04_15555 [Mycolicibacterium fallax]BBY97208.1 hypothetical protein MFAL_06750 [Mycolicibacterium fallax]
MTDPGLQHERTELAWERTAISLAALAGVMMFHDVAAVRLTLAMAAVLLALLALGLSQVRRRRGTPATVAVPVIGWSVAALAALSLIALR